MSATIKLTKWNNNYLVYVAGILKDFAPTIVDARAKCLSLGAKEIIFEL